MTVQLCGRQYCKLFIHVGVRGYQDLAMQSIMCVCSWFFSDTYYQLLTHRTSSMPTHTTRHTQNVTGVVLRTAHTDTILVYDAYCSMWVNNHHW